MKKRKIYSDAVINLAFRYNKMSFIAGPRQVGKTTLSHEIASHFQKNKYHTWDDPVFKRQWIKDPKALIETDIGPKSLLVLDELHKAPRWKTYLKGLYDLRNTHAHILVTGSAKLDTFRRGGDSLLGRYFLTHLHPFSLGELHNSQTSPDEFINLLSKNLDSRKSNFQNLMEFGGFPEPFLKKEKEFYHLWKRNRVERLIREDLVSLAQAQDISLIETMASLLPERVGSPFSLQSLSEDLSIAHPTAKRWVQWLEQLYYIYIIPPYFKRQTRSLKKQPKIYLWDWAEIENEAARFENMVASHLLKTCHFWTDTGKGNFSLYYVRDKEKRESDFFITKNKKPWVLIECKTSDTNPDSSLIHFEEMLKPEIAIQIVYETGVHRTFALKTGKEGYVISADKFLGTLV